MTAKQTIDFGAVPFGYLLRDDEKTVVERAFNELLRRPKATVEKTIDHLVRKGFSARVGGCGCDYMYGGYCGGDDRAVIYLGDVEACFLIEGKTAFLEGVEPGKELSKIVRTIEHVLASTQTSWLDQHRALIVAQGVQADYDHPAFDHPAYLEASAVAEQQLNEEKPQRCHNAVQLLSEYGYQAKEALYNGEICVEIVVPQYDRTLLFDFDLVSLV